MYVNFGSSQRILGMLFLCITVPPLSTTHHLLRSWSSLQPLLAELRTGKHREDIVMHLRVKTYLKCLQGFQRKHLNVGVVFFLRGLSALAELCFILSNTLQRCLLCSRKPPVTSRPEHPLYSMYGA